MDLAARQPNAYYDCLLHVDATVQPQQHAGVYVKALQDKLGEDSIIRRLIRRSALPFVART